jgi:hypothetical protein
MARGWESKSVEEQQAESKQQNTGSVLNKEQAEGRRIRDGLLLSRKNVASQLESATSPVYRQMLERALADLDQKLAKLHD